MNYKTKTNLILPFSGTWLVSNGGRDPEKNNHIRVDGPQNQQFGYDFRQKRKGTEKNLEDFEVFGKEVIAPGSGVIAQIIDGSIDVEFGERDRSVGVGNTIIIDHQNGEFSLLCHFKHNSIRVKPKNRVKQGETMGLCGNTGNTSEPHIHFNLQDNKLMHRAKALPAQFGRILVDGELKTDCEPERGQMVQNAR